jgi:Cd2+/Zn2+-exporting ATPase
MCRRARSDSAGVFQKVADGLYSNVDRNVSDGGAFAAEQDDDQCLVRTIRDAMAVEPALEAVRIDRERKSISVATLGRPRNPGLEKDLTARIEGMRQESGAAACALLAGDGDCDACPHPAPAGELASLKIERDGHVTTIARITCPTAPTFWRWREIPWPRFVPREFIPPGDAPHDIEWKLPLLAAGLCGGFGLAAWLAGGVSTGSGISLFVMAYLAGGWFTAVEVWERLRNRTLDVHFLMLAVAAGSAAIGAWGEGTTLLFLFSLSGALEHYAMGRTQREIQSLFRAAPKVATTLDESGVERTVAVEALRPGMRLLIKPGEQFPVDGEVLKGQTASDESNLTGEAVPVEKGIGDAVMAGTINLWGVVEAGVTRPASQSALQKIIHLIQEAQHLKAPSQRFTDRFGSGYTYGILGLTFGMFLVWWLGFGYAPFIAPSGGRSAFYLAMTLLVVASPCALVLSIPSAILAAIAWAARRGILFRGGAAVEKLAEVTVVAMDKTGTLTTGELRVERIESYPPGREDEIAQLAYSLERWSTHPLARAITRYGKRRGLTVIPLDRFESVTGFGLKARDGEREVVLGKREWVLTQAAEGSRSMPPMAEAGLSEVWLACDGLAGRVVLRDDLRAEAGRLVEHLRELGLSSVVLTGDREGPASRLKGELRLDDVRAGLHPEEKVRAIEEFARQGRKVAMIGDGVNDAPSLAAAHVGVAMGARGSDAALEQAEVVLMHDRLENFLAAYQLSQRAGRIIRQNLVISLGTVAVLVAFALAGRIPLTLGVLGHEGSTVVVVLNSLRLLITRKAEKSHGVEAVSGGKVGT